MAKGPRDTDRAPRWTDDPPWGFDPKTGESQIVDDASQLPKTKIKGPDGKLYTPEEWVEKQNSELDLDSMSVEELQALVDGLDATPEKG
jgi:hypothetical protein